MKFAKLAVLRLVQFLQPAVLFIVAGFHGLVGNPQLGFSQDWIRDERPANWREDAELTDLHFVNAKTGFAVGAQGTIVRTNDGGESWSTFSFVQQTSNFGEMSLAEKIKKAADRKVQDFSRQKDLFCRFTSISFANENNGWIAGGYKIPLLNQDRGLLFRTRDGGKTWQEIKGTFLPAMSKIEMQQLPPNPIGHVPPGHRMGHLQDQFAFWPSHSRNH